jgi:hypothetical protein
LRLLAAVLAALLAGCASPKLPATTPIAEPVRAAGSCDKYRDPTTAARCRLFSSADGWQFVPPAGRSADLETQLRCAPLRPKASAYERCVSALHRSSGFAAPAPATPRVSALPDLRPSAAEPLTRVLAPRVEPRPQEPTPAEPANLRSPPTAMSDDAIRRSIIEQSIAGYAGSCPCPYNVDRGGRRCGGRSAYSRPGGASPICYPSDVPASAVAAYSPPLAIR